jgi:chromosome segregation ATPase
MKYSELSGRYDELSKAYQQVQQEKALLQSRYSELRRSAWRSSS